jgi:hypothetical protein
MLALLSIYVQIIMSSASQIKGERRGERQSSPTRLQLQCASRHYNCILRRITSLQSWVNIFIFT